jgi:hypothetical protein
MIMRLNATYVLIKTLFLKNTPNKKTRKIPSSFYCCLLVNCLLFDQRFMEIVRMLFVIISQLLEQMY